jgi:hypothetical protein
MKLKDLPKPVRDFLLKYLWFRPGIVYAYSTLDPDTHKREPWSYIGQTRQALAARHAQHMGVDSRYQSQAQPWSDLYPDVRVVWKGRVPDFLLDFLEMLYIKKYLPLYNYMHNTKNPRRIPKHQAVKARKNRDRLARMRRPW